MFFSVDASLSIIIFMALLSLWKTYSGPAIAGILAYSYPEMLLFNLLPALLAAYLGWRLAPYLFQRRSSVKSKHFRPKLRPFMKRWNQYGQVSVAFLAPVLVGVPTYAIISKRLNQKLAKTFSLLILSMLFWSALSYFLFLLVDIKQYIDIRLIIPESILSIIRDLRAANN